MDSDAPGNTGDLVAARLAATAAATAGDAATLYHLVAGLMDEGYDLDSVLFDVLGTVQRNIGKRWQAGDYLVSEEHAATATVETVVALLSGALDRPTDGPEVVVAAVPGDLHSLPGRLVAAQLLFSGFHTTFLGANVLASDLEEFLETEPPAALVLSCSMTGHLLGARAAIRAGHATGTPVLVGGRGFGEAGEWAKLVGADAWASTAPEVPVILRSWRPDPARAEAEAAEPSAELLDLMARRAEVIATALGSLSERSLETSPRVFDELTILEGAVEASLLVGDERPVLDTLAWQEQTLGAHRLPLAGAIAIALQGALTEVSPEAARILEGAGRSS